MKPTFSVIIPVYNVAPYLRDCLDSVLSQTFANWEAICVDDGSTDESGKILDEYANMDVRIKVIHQSNVGQGGARNSAFENVNGEWIVFLDGDDVLHRNCLSVCAKELERCPSLDVVRFKMVAFGQYSRPIWPKQKMTISYSDLSRMLSIDAIQGSIGQRAYRWEKIKDIRSLQILPGEDCAWVAEAIFKMDSMADVDYVGYGYRQRQGSAMHCKVTYDMVCSSLYWRIHCLDVWNRSPHSGKIASPELLRYIILSLTEGFSLRFFRELSEDMRDRVWLKWMEAINYLVSKDYLPLWNRLTVRFVSRTHSRAMAWLLFFVPYWLKMHGVHR